MCVLVFTLKQLMQHHTVREKLEGMKREIKKTHLLQSCELGSVFWGGGV